MKKLRALLVLLVLAKCATAQIALPSPVKGKIQSGKSLFIGQADGSFIYLTATGGNFYSGRLFPNGDIDDAYNGPRSSKKAYGHLINCKTITANHDKWGRMLVGGSSCIDSGSGRMATMVRLTKTGDPDADFTPGIMQMKLGDSSEFDGVYLQDDEKIMAIGSYYSGGNAHTFLARLQYNGEKDLSFGKNGIVTDDGIGYSYMSCLTATQPGGKYIVVGKANTDEQQIIAKRYNQDALLDTMFGTDGGYNLINDGFRDVQSHSVLLQPDNKILIAGTCAGIREGQDIFLVRLTAQGLIDTTFGTSGMLRVDIAKDDRADDIALLSDGRILLSGGCSVKGEAKYGRFIMLRFSAEGVPEKGYGYGSAKGLPPLSLGTGYSSLANNIAIPPRGGKADRLSELIATNEIETVLTFTTYLQDSSLGLVDIPSGKLQNFVYPVPVSKSVTFSFGLIDDLNISVKLLDANGSEISTIKNKEPYLEGDNAVTINFPPNSKPGKYLIVLSSESGYKITVEVTKV